MALRHLDLGWVGIKILGALVPMRLGALLIPAPISPIPNPLHITRIINH